MQHDIQVLDRVKSAYATLRPSEQRVADQVLADPEKCTRCTIAELADQVQVSQPTVVRFVQALGFDGYRSFKYCLLRDRSGKSPKSPYFDHLGDFDLKPWDRLEDLPLKETRIAGRLLEDALKFLSADALSRAVRMLATARTIDIYGGGKLRHTRQRSAHKTYLSGPQLPDAHRHLSPADLCRPSGSSRCGGWGMAIPSTP